MKKSMFTILLLLSLAWAVPALGEGAAADPEAIYTWSYVGTTAGAAAAAALVTQFIKGLLDKLGHVPTRAVVLVLCMGFMCGAQAVQGTLEAKNLPILLLNAIVAATSAMGLYQVTFAKLEEKNDDADGDAGAD